MKTLETLFDSRARVRLMRLFLINTRDAFENKDLSTRTKEQANIVRKELAILSKAGLIKKVSFFKEVPGKTKKAKPKKKRVSGWQLDQSFPYLAALQHLVVTSVSMRQDDIIKRLKKAGNIKLVVLSGIFIREDESTVDILVVGDKLRKSALESALGLIEAEIGKQLTYAFLETSEFKYRINMYDKFIRDVFDYPHDKIMDKIGVSERV